MVARIFTKRQAWAQKTASPRVCTKRLPWHLLCCSPDVLLCYSSQKAKCGMCGFAKFSRMPKLLRIYGIGTGHNRSRLSYENTLLRNRSNDLLIPLHVKNKRRLLLAACCRQWTFANASMRSFSTVCRFQCCAYLLSRLSQLCRLLPVLIKSMLHVLPSIYAGSIQQNARSHPATRVLVLLQVARAASPRNVTA